MRKMVLLPMFIIVGICLCALVYGIITCFIWLRKGYSVDDTTIKVLVFSGYGGDPSTEKMKEIMKKQNGVRSRVGDIVDYIEKTCVLWDSLGGITQVKAATKENPNLIVDSGQVIIDDVLGKRYYVWDKKYASLSNFSILEVDSSRPWTIEEYDGAEYVAYLDEKKMYDEELNYWK